MVTPAARDGLMPPGACTTPATGAEADRRGRGGLAARAAPAGSSHPGRAGGMTFEEDDRWLS